MGRVLRVDLTTGSHSVETVDPELHTAFIGGRGAGVKVLFDEVDPGIDGFSAENKLVFSVGPLTGTGAITGCKFCVVTKSPLTGGIACSSSEGFFGTEVKQAGYDMVVLEGKAAQPAVLEVCDGGVTLSPAGHLWGLTTSQTEELIKTRMHDRWKARDTCVACIGPAGEKLCRIASIVNDRHWAAARSGVGAVMGSKNLKAVVVAGTKDIAVASGKPFMDIVLAYLEQVKSTPHTAKSLPEVGTGFMVDLMNDAGALATRNFQTGVFHDVARVNGEAVRRLVSRQMGCFSCPIGCEHLVKSGAANGMGPGYDVLAALGPCCGVSDLESVVQANHLCLDLGLDPISAGATVSCAMEMFEKGVLPESDAGLALRFGDGKALVTMIERMGRRQGLGDLLAEGGFRLAEQYGHGGLFMGVKKQECPPCDPRGVQGVGLQFATSNHGANYDDGDTLIDEVLGLGSAGEPGLAEGKAALVKSAQDLAAVLDSCGLCRRMLMGGFTIMEVFAMMEMVTASGMSDSDLLQAGERIYNLERLFNLKAGLAGQDALPRRLTHEPAPEGKARGQVSRLAEMLPEYYQLRGWDAAGTPTAEKLAELGLDGGTGDGGRLT